MVNAPDRPESRQGRSKFLLVTMLLRMVLGSMTGMFFGIEVMTMGYVRMVCALLVVSGFVMFSGLGVVVSCLFTVLSCVLVVFCMFLRHKIGFN
jgi:hypothetical protein